MQTILGSGGSVGTELAKAAQWFCNADVILTMGYTPDLARGTAMLGNTEDAYKQVWNLPVDMNALTGREWNGLFAEEMPEMR